MRICDVTFGDNGGDEDYVEDEDEEEQIGKSTAEEEVDGSPIVEASQPFHQDFYPGRPGHQWLQKELDMVGENTLLE